MCRLRLVGGPRMIDEPVTEEELDEFLKRAHSELVKEIIRTSPDTETALRRLKEKAARELGNR